MTSHGLGNKGIAPKVTISSPEAPCTGIFRLAALIVKFSAARFVIKIRFRILRIEPLECPVMVKGIGSFCEPDIGIVRLRFCIGLLYLCSAKVCIQMMEAYGPIKLVLFQADTGILVIGRIVGVICRITRTVTECGRELTRPAPSTQPKPLPSGVRLTSAPENARSVIVSGSGASNLPNMRRYVP